jgi:hypothetical protein
MVMSATWLRWHRGNDQPLYERGEQRGRERYSPVLRSATDLKPAAGNSARLPLLCFRGIPCSRVCPSRPRFFWGPSSLRGSLFGARPSTFSVAASTCWPRAKPVPRRARPKNRRRGTGKAGECRTPGPDRGHPPRGWSNFGHGLADPRPPWGGGGHRRSERHAVRPAESAASEGASPRRCLAMTPRIRGPKSGFRENFSRPRCLSGPLTPESRSDVASVVSYWHRGCSRH